MLHPFLEKIPNKIKNYRDLKYCPLLRRHDDLYLVSYPKSGVTWLSALVAKLLLTLDGEDREINLFNVQDFIPDIHVSRLIQRQSPFKRVDFRVLKSHSPYNFHYKKVLHLVRDPRDVMISYWHYLTSLNQYNGSISDLIRSPDYGIEKWVRHSNSWMRGVSPEIVLNYIRYEELRSDANKVLGRILYLLGFENNLELVQKVVTSLSLRKMKEFENNYKIFNLNLPDEHDFIRKGESGGWQNILTASDANFISEKAHDLMNLIGYK